MKESDIRKYAQLMKELELTGLEITEDNRVVRLERTVPAVVTQTVAAEAPAAEADPVVDIVSEIMSTLEISDSEETPQGETPAESGSSKRSKLGDHFGPGYDPTKK